MMKITGLSHFFKWENLHNWWLTKYFFAPLYIYVPVAQWLEHCVSSAKVVGLIPREHMYYQKKYIA